MLSSTNIQETNQLDVAAIREQFPILDRTVRGGKPLIYLDSAATAQRPIQVVVAMEDFALKHNGAVHRGTHQLGEEATEAFEDARQYWRGFVGAAPDEIVWTSGATAALNLVANGIKSASTQATMQAATSDVPNRFILKPGDEIAVTQAEHHSNLVPWQELAKVTGAKLRWFTTDDQGRINLKDIGEIITEKTKVVAFTHVSNVTGAITPIAEIVSAAKAVGAITVLDACQSAPHIPLDFHELDVDFAAFSSHKMFGPDGVGVLFGKRDNLAALPPVNFGGSMVETVTMEHATYLPPPLKFEAGTQMVTEAIGMAKAAQWLTNIGCDRLIEYEHLLKKELLKIGEIPGISIIGPVDTLDRIALVSFSVDGVHPHDVSQILDDAGIAVRVGQHCAQPIHRRFGVTASVRASATIYNTVDEITAFRQALSQVRPFFGV